MAGQRTRWGPAWLLRADVRNRGRSLPSGAFASGIGAVRAVALGSLELRAARQPRLLAPCPVWLLLLLLGPLPAPMREFP